MGLNAINNETGGSQHINTSRAEKYIMYKNREKSRGLANVRGKERERKSRPGITDRSESFVRQIAE